MTRSSYILVLPCTIPINNHNDKKMLLVTVTLHNGRRTERWTVTVTHFIVVEVGQSVGKAHNDNQNERSDAGIAAWLLALSPLAWLLARAGTCVPEL